MCLCLDTAYEVLPPAVITQMLQEQNAIMKVHFIFFPRSSFLNSLENSFLQFDWAGYKLP